MSGLPERGRGRLAGRVAVVTGAASGIGRVTAETFAGEGASVVVADIDEAGAEAAAAAIRDRGGDAVGCPVDVADEALVAAMVATTLDRYGALHILHNNAAITDPAHQRRDAALTDLDVDVWDRTFAVDLRGAMLCCKHAIPAMISSEGGSIINTSSNSALAGDLTLTAYAAAKGGMNSLTLSVATAYGKQGIRCNAVSPAHILSPSMAANVAPEVIDLLAAQCLTPHMGTPQDVANLVVFLASDESRFVTGQILRVDGGALSHLAHVAQLRDAQLTTVRVEE
ncbi:MAG: SDR family oxidoreductase [Acidimicrobiales bacterium]|nr:SDR family oxidoreductase [Acidimicrobiales bacterium]